MHRSSTLSTLLAAVAACASLGLPASPAAAATTPLATATYGKAEVAVVKDPARPGHRQLTYASGGDGPPVVVDVALPAKLERIGLGLDATGLLTAVVQTPSGISWSHVTDPSEFKRVPNTKGAVGAALYRGRVAYLCQGGYAVCRASLRTKTKRVLHRETKTSPWRLDDVRIGGGDAIAISSVRDGALGASRIQVKRSGGRPRVVAEGNLDGGEEVLLGAVSPDGQHLSILRRSYFAGGEPLEEPVDTLAFFTFPGGKPAS